MITFLKALFFVVFVYMCYVVIGTSLESNLFAEWSNLASIPWMVATIKDFYANILIIGLWMWYKERSAVTGILWSAAFVLLGSIGTSAYVLTKLFGLRAGEGVPELLVRRS